MGNVTDLVFCGILLLICILFEASAETCSEAGSSWWSIKYRYCSNGCCGNYYDRECCADVSVGAIIGICISIAAVSVFVIIVIVCIAKSKKARVTGVVHTSNAPNVTVVSTGLQQSPHYPQPPNHGQPMTYQQLPGQFPPPNPNMAYPPPPPTYMPTQ